MIAIVQRVKKAALKADGKDFSSIGAGLFVLLGVTVDDGEADGAILAKKCADLRIFEDENGKMNRSVRDVGGEVLVVSNFTLCADTSHGNRPSFIRAARPEQANPLYEQFVKLLSENVPVQTGVFGAEMEIATVCDGPITVTLDSTCWVKR